MSFGWDGLLGDHGGQFGSQSAKIINQTQVGDERAQENWFEGKLDGRRVFIDVQNVCRFAAVKGVMLR